MLMLPDKLRLYWHTLRYLRPVQFYGRLWFRFTRPRVDQRAPPSLRMADRHWVLCRRPTSMVAPRAFVFLGVRRELAHADDWNRTDWPKLWLYNAHYFDDLASSGAADRALWHQALITSWIEENPLGRGNGWEPYPSSLRIVNWVKWVLSGNILDDKARHSLAIQVRFLRKRLEYHLLGNHLWANAKALLFAGAFFEGDEADAWREKGLALLRRELREQILTDGGHFERSPMYHAILLEDMLDLIQLAQVFPTEFGEHEVDSWRRVAFRMMHWLHVMSHPDGGIAFFNDAALGIAPDVAALSEYAERLSLQKVPKLLSDIEVLPDSGYVRLQVDEAILIADVAPVGPDYLPGHAHADTLSFELSLCGQRVLVNGGTSTYASGPERLRQRGTAMHNTVLVDHANSSEVWGSFRVACRAKPSGVRSGSEHGAVWLEAEHDGYRRLPGRVTHRRRWTLHNDGLSICDTLAGRYHYAEARFRFVPDASVSGEGATEGAVELGRLRLRWSGNPATSARVELSQWHPYFGVSQPCQVLALPISGNALATEFFWS